MLRNKNGIPSFFSSAEWFRTEFWEFACIFPRNGIPSCFLFSGMFQYGILTVCLYFFHGMEFLIVVSSAEWLGKEVPRYNNTEFQHFSLPRNGSERNFESFLFHGTAGNLPEQTICFVYSVFRGINLGRKFPILHCKKRLATFPSPAGMSPTKLSLVGNNLIIAAQGEFGKWHPCWGRENR